MSDVKTEISRRDFFIAHAIQGALAGGMRAPKDIVPAAILTADMALNQIDAGAKVNVATGQIEKKQIQAPIERPPGEKTGLSGMSAKVAR